VVGRLAENTHLSASEVCQVAGISYRQLDDWCRTGLVPLDDPMPGSGHHRRYDQAAVDRVVQIATLRQQLSALRQEVRASRREQGLPETVSDSDTVARVAGMLRGAGT
jgi:DNA-binding transcriptional MerR regulator